ncbi:MAG: Crp/Fnr family transcriptional regulator [Prochloraceae cyanobacterium]|nr:Crp/Fnr family transcriptional regulator [Prochloraceae cyanobacterium]
MLLSYQATKNIPFTGNKQEQEEEQRLHFYEKGEEIPTIAQGIWQVYRGIVQLGMLHQSGTEVLLGWAYPSTFFGRWLTYTETYQAKALCDVYLKWYSLEEIEASQNLARTIVTQVARRMRQTEALLAIAGMRRVEDRLQELLKLLKQEIGEPVAGGTKLKIRLTHQNIANAIGTTRVTITRLLGEFQRNGYITLDRDRLIIILNDGDRGNNFQHN